MTALDTLTTTTIDYTPETNDQPPRIWWHNGDKKTKTPGSFYTKIDELGEAPGEPWQPDDRFDNEEGFSAKQLNIAIIGHRGQAYRQDGADSPRVWLRQYEPGALIYTEVLCLVEGITQPVVWACKGLTGKAVTGKGDGIVDRYKLVLLREVEKQVKKALPPWSFWLPIASEVDQSNKLVFSDTGYGSTITRPRIHWPSTNVKELIDTLFVGKDLLELGASIRTEYKDWFAVRRANEEAEPQPVTVPARNVPTPLSEEDLPF